MDELWTGAVIVGMFALRLGVPLAITLAIGYFLRRVDAKWQAEALAYREANRTEEKTLAGRESFDGEQPCWVIKMCDESVRAKCPAPLTPNIPCWLARRRVEGTLPVECYDCDRFSLRQVAERVAS